MRAHMEQASRIALGGFTVRTHVVIVKHPDPAYVPGSAGTTAQVWFRTLGASVPAVSFENNS